MCLIQPASFRAATVDFSTMTMIEGSKPQRATRRRSSLGNGGATIGSGTQGTAYGSKRCKRYVEHNYSDHYNDPIYRPGQDDGEEDSPRRRGPRGGVVTPFPERLHDMLSQVEKDGYEDVVSWQPHGRCFIVHNPKRFVEDVMPKYFRQSKLTSFQRQVNLYGFRRLTAGKDRGAYYHEMFLRGRPDLHKKLVRIRVKGTGFKSASSPATEPDFYAYPTCEESGPDFFKNEPSDPAVVSSTANTASEVAMPLAEPGSTGNVPIEPLWKPLAAPPEMVKSAHPFSGAFSLTSIAKNIVEGASQEEACPITPDTTVSRQMVSASVEEALAMVSPTDSPVSSPFPSMLSVMDAATHFDIPPPPLSSSTTSSSSDESMADMEDPRMNAFQQGIDQLLSVGAAPSAPGNDLMDNALMEGDAVDDFALDPLFLLEEVASG